MNDQKGNTSDTELRWEDVNYVANREIPIDRRTVRVKFNEYVKIQGYERESWEQWNEGMEHLDEMATQMLMDPARSARFKYRTERKLAKRIQNPNWDGKFGFPATLQNDKEVADIVSDMPREMVVYMVNYYRKSVVRANTVNVRAKLQLAVEEHKSHLLHDFAEQKERENVRLRKAVSALSKKVENIQNVLQRTSSVDVIAAEVNESSFEVDDDSPSFRLTTPEERRRKRSLDLASNSTPVRLPDRKSSSVTPLRRKRRSMLQDLEPQNSLTTIKFTPKKVSEGSAVLTRSNTTVDVKKLTARTTKILDFMSKNGAECDHRELTQKLLLMKKAVNDNVMNRRDGGSRYPELGKIADDIVETLRVWEDIAQEVANFETPQKKSPEKIELPRSEKERFRRVLFSGSPSDILLDNCHSPRENVLKSVETLEEIKTPSSTNNGFIIPFKIPLLSPGLEYSQSTHSPSLLSQWIPQSSQFGRIQPGLSPISCAMESFIPMKMPETFEFPRTSTPNGSPLAFSTSPSTDDILLKDSHNDGTEMLSPEKDLDKTIGVQTVEDVDPPDVWNRCRSLSPIKEDSEEFNERNLEGSFESPIPEEYYDATPGVDGELCVDELDDIVLDNSPMRLTAFPNIRSPRARSSNSPNTVARIERLAAMMRSEEGKSDCDILERRSAQVDVSVDLEKGQVMDTAEDAPSTGWLCAFKFF